MNLLFRALAWLCVAQAHFLFLPLGHFVPKHGGSTPAADPRRGGVCDPDGQAVGSLKYLAGHESPLWERRGGALQSVPAQSAPLVRKGVLCAGKGFGPAGRHPRPLQRQHHPHLYHGERGRPRPADWPHGAGDYIVFILWLHIYFAL